MGRKIKPIDFILLSIIMLILFLFYGCENDGVVFEKKYTEKKCICEYTFWFRGHQYFTQDSCKKYSVGEKIFNIKIK